VTTGVGVGVGAAVGVADVSAADSSFLPQPAISETPSAMPSANVEIFMAEVDITEAETNASKCPIPCSDEQSTDVDTLPLRRMTAGDQISRFRTFKAFSSMN